MFTFPSFTLTGACRLPKSWRGRWYRNTERPLGPVTISETDITGIGQCVSKYKSDYYLLRDRCVSKYKSDYYLLRDRCFSEYV